MLQPNRKSSRLLFYFLVTGFLVTMSFAAEAACTNPAGSEGDLVYNDDEKILQYCDNTNWIGLHAAGPGSGGCTNPSRGEGTVVYNGDENVPQVCAGTMWLALGKLNSGAAGGGCSNPTKDEGTIVYNDDHNVMQYCDGSTWKHLYGSSSSPTGNCPNIGDVCADGTIYAGLSGASTPMYTTRCDAGQTWNGSSCTGTRSSLCWNACNATGSVDTSVTNGATTDGQSYTATLITEDSDSITSGTQQHQAAQYCADLNLNGRNDWYLPASNELTTLYTNRVAIGNFDTSTYYFSSSENSEPNAYAVRFSDGNLKNNTGKKSSYLVRCARR